MNNLKQALRIFKKLNKQEKERPMWEGFDEASQRLLAVSGPTRKEIDESLIFTSLLSPDDGIDEFGLLRAQVDGSDIVIEQHAMGHLVLTPRQARLLLAWLKKWAEEQAS